jgi:hypothetical protein
MKIYDEILMAHAKNPSGKISLPLNFVKQDIEDLCDSVMLFFEG